MSEYPTPQILHEDAVSALYRIVVGPLQNNVYVLQCRATDQHLLIDAADQPDAITSMLESLNGRLMGILTTHRHGDHHRALPQVAEATGVPTFASALDGAELPIPPHHVLAHGDTLEVGQLELRVHELRGHTLSGLALAWEGEDRRWQLITGDSLFPGGPGKTVTNELFTLLMNDLESRIFEVYPDDTAFYPGHGESSTLGAERPHLSEWRLRGW